MKKILAICGHPDSNSLNASLLKSYIKGAEESGAEVRRIFLGDLNYDPILKKGYQEIQELEPDLIKSQEDILWADHLVFFYPIWWGTIPALMKGFFDRSFLPGFSYQFHDGKQIPEKLLKGKSAHLFVCMDSPSFYYKLFLGSPGHKMMKRAILKFCGVNPVKITEFCTVKLSDEDKRKKWLNTTYIKGKRLL